MPARNLRTGLQMSVEELTKTRNDTRKVLKESEVARKYFGNLVSKSRGDRAVVDRVDLEGGAPGVASGFESGVMI